jgi:hypothetical protein
MGATCLGLLELQDNALPALQLRAAAFLDSLEAI